MPIVDFTKPLIIVFALIIYTVLMYISYKRRKSIVIALMLFTSLMILIFHSADYILLKPDTVDEIKKALMYSIIGDMFFIYLSFISYLYLDKKFEELFVVLGGYDGKYDIVIFGSDHIRYGRCKHQRKYQHNSRL
mgnify:CR=1 FL=1